MQSVFNLNLNFSWWNVRLLPIQHFIPETLVVRSREFLVSIIPEATENPAIWQAKTKYHNCATPAETVQGNRVQWNSSREKRHRGTSYSPGSISR